MTTAIEAAKDGGFTPGTALLATGKNYADAVSSGPLAGALNAPLYFSVTPTLEASVLQAMLDSGVKKVYVIGGTASVSEVKVLALRIAGIEVERLTGANRAETAVAITHKLTALGHRPAKFFLASGLSYADALGAGVAAGREKGAVLLTEGGRLPVSSRETLSDFQGVPVVVVGGAASAAMDDPVLAGRESKLIMGVDRFDTAGKLFTEFSANATKLVIASGTDFADALAAGPRALAGNAGVLLVRASDVTPATRRALVGAKVDAVEVLGGKRSVNDSVLVELERILRP